MTLLKTSIESLRARARHLRADFEYWRGRTATNGDLRQHQSQVTRITDTLTGALKESLGETPVLEPDPVPAHVGLGALPEFRRDIGSIHLLWEFFRDKFAQRDVDLFQDHLGSADDLAWACYSPCLDAAVTADALSVDDVKEPPLVFYSTYRTPFAQARTKMFHPQGLDSKDIEVFAEVLMSLPVPVIGVPWAIANRLPELVLVGHETGHVVAEDLGLATEARAALEAVALPNDAGARRKGAWLSWCDEVFADLFGVLATGQAFVLALGAELAADVHDIRGRRVDEENPGAYPTPMIRMGVCEAALARLGVTPSDTWRSAYAELSGNARSYANDIGAIVDALLLREWDALGQKRLTEILPWGAAQEEQAQSVAQASLSQHPVAVPFNVRVWIAASMHAAEKDPATFASLSIDRVLAESIVNRRADAVRFTHARSMRARLAPGITEQQSEIEQEQRDLKTGRKLYGLLKALQ